MDDVRKDKLQGSVIFLPPLSSIFSIQWVQGRELFGQYKMCTWEIVGVAITYCMSILSWHIVKIYVDLETTLKDHSRIRGPEGHNVVDVM